MSSSETGCGDGEELGLEAAAEAGGLTSFSEGRERREEQRQSAHMSRDVASVQAPGQPAHTNRAGDGEAKDGPVPRLRA